MTVCPQSFSLTVPPVIRNASKPWARRPPGLGKIALTGELRRKMCRSADAPLLAATVRYLDGLE
jgi:hypothetical protein